MDSFFGIGVMELAFIAILALIILGPERLPGAARETAKIFGQIRALSSEFTSQFSEELEMLDEINPKKLADDIVKETMNPPKKPADNQTKSKPLSPSANAQPTTVRTHKTPDGPPPDEAENSILPPGSDKAASREESTNGAGAEDGAAADSAAEPGDDGRHAADDDAAEQAA